jgi:hypothetical protein
MINRKIRLLQKVGKNGLDFLATVARRKEKEKTTQAVKTNSHIFLEKYPI